MKDLKLELRRQLEFILKMTVILIDFFFLLSANEWIANFEKKVKPLWESTQQIPDTEATQLGKKDPDVYP